MSTTAATQPSIDVVDQFTESVWNGRDYDRIEELVTDDVVFHPTVGYKDLTSISEITDNIRQYHDAFSDLTMSVDYSFADESGEYVCTMWTATGTHDGELMGIPATDVEGEISAMGVFRLEDGRISESWVIADLLTLFSQLGEMPDMDILTP